MSFVELQNFADGPERRCPEKFGGLLAVFKPGVLEDHDRLGYSFRPNACLDVVAYDPDVCVPGDVKMEPGRYPAEKEAVLGVIQSAIVCSTVGATMDELREEARLALSENLERAIEADFITYLLANDTPSGGPLQAKCVLSEAAQYLATSSECGRGLIVGPVSWFVQLEETLVWNNAKGYHTDFVGNIVIPHSLDNDTVFALDMAVDIKVSEVLVLDELAPGVTTVNDRVVRAEQLYTVAVDSCTIASFTVGPCCECASGGGGGGGGSVTVTNLCSCVQDVNVTNPVDVNGPIDVNILNNPVDVESQLLCDVLNGEVVGTALAVYEYDENGNPTGPPTFVNPVTNTPYVVQGVLQHCQATCCPINIGDGCWNDGLNSGQWTAIRNSDGTIELIDPVTGNTINPVDVVDCPSENVATLSTHHKDLTNGGSWTPADAVGIVTSITYTILTGVADVTDSSAVVVTGLPAGLTATWNNDTEGSLTTPPQSILAPGAGDRVYVNWTERV